MTPGVGNLLDSLKIAHILRDRDMPISARKLENYPLYMPPLEILTLELEGLLAHISLYYVLSTLTLRYGPLRALSI